MIPSYLSLGVLEEIIYSVPYTYMNAHVMAFKGAKEGLCKKDRDCYLLAKTIVYEARGEPLEGMASIGFVILNRVNNKRWPDSVEKVVKQPHQFSFWKDKHRQRKPSSEDWTKGYEVAYDVLNRRIENPVGVADHYHSVNISPKWTKNMEFVVQLGQHIFYKN